MPGAWVSRARLHAADGAPIPTKQTSSLFRSRAAWIVIISLALYSGIEHVLLHPCLKPVAVARDRVPGRVEGVVALVVAMRVRGARAARRLDDAAHGPMREDDRVRAAEPQVVDDFLDRHDRAPGGEHRLLLHADDPLEEHVALPIGSLRVDDRDVGPNRRDRREPLAGERAFD